MDKKDSSIKDNRERGGVGDFLKKHIDNGSDLSIVSAYFTIYAYYHLKDKLDNINHLRFLFGEPTFIKNFDPAIQNKKVFKINNDELVIPSENRLQQKAIAKYCSDWIQEKVDIRSMTKSEFLHGKMYHIKTSNGVHNAVIGSSNFTAAGLGFSKASNIELNLSIQDDRDRKDLLSWFDEIWNDESGVVQDVKKDVLNYLKKIYKENDPEFIYFKTLYHIFKDYLDEQKEEGLIDTKIGLFDTDIWEMLFSFQKDAVKGALNKIIKYNGCIIADSVGLGKTFEALAIIKYFELRNERVLVLVPKRLRENWTLYKRNDRLNPLLSDRFNYDVLNHTDLSRETGKSGDIALETINWSNYDLVVIDESHNFRNHIKSKTDENGNIVKMSRYEKLMNNIIKSGIKTKVLLLSATPVNNSLKDLRNQLYFILGNNEHEITEKIGIKNIDSLIKNAQTVFTKWAEHSIKNGRKVNKLMEKLDASFFKLLDTLSIARSRKHIKSFYSDEMQRIGGFSERRPVQSEYPDIDIRQHFPPYDSINKDINEYKLSLFTPSLYLKEDYKQEYETKINGKFKAFTQTGREHFLIGMMKIGFLKRLESSIHSFEITMKRTIDKIDDLIEKIENFKSQKELHPEIDYESIVLEGEEDEDIKSSYDIFIGKKLQYNLAHLNLDKWLKDLKEDRDSILSLFNKAKMITPERDKKLLVLKKIIREKITNPINDKNKKILIFTAFADTAEYLYNNLVNYVQKELHLNIALVTGGKQNRTTLGRSEFNHILTSFSPKSKGRKKMPKMPQDEEIDVLVATDCISEGQNLQDCDYMINYDIHWNPVRIIQRFGRIDRIGSENKYVQMVNFWPTKDLDNYIKLKSRVETKMALVDLTTTGQGNLLEEKQIEDLINEDLKYREKQLKKLQKEVLDLEDIDESLSITDFTLDDFRAELINYIQKNKEKLAEAPLGLYAVVPATKGKFAKYGNYSSIKDETKNIILPGVIFCLKQKNAKKENGEINPISPYLLVYIREDKVVRFNFIHPKQILEIFRILAQKVDKPYEKLCDIFNNQTNNGENMEKYNDSLNAAINKIKLLFNKRIDNRLSSSRDGKIISEKHLPDNTDNLELITWLVIK
ncbi:MAG: helicase-related protein [Promethearchaeota archaeon]